MTKDVTNLLTQAREGRPILLCRAGAYARASIVSRKFIDTISTLFSVKLARARDSKNPGKQK